MQANAIMKKGSSFGAGVFSHFRYALLDSFGIRMRNRMCNAMIDFKLGQANQVLYLDRPKSSSGFDTLSPKIIMPGWI